MTGNRFLDYLNNSDAGFWEKQHGLNQMPALNSILNHKPVFNKILSYSPGNFYRTMPTAMRLISSPESESQIERVRDIFAELILKLTFNSLLLNLHSGFTDHDLKISIIYRSPDI